MGTGKKTPHPPRNLKVGQLGGVVFGCTDSTMKECLSEQLFGLPAQHFMYVQNIYPGLPLFLFNYSKRALHGVFEAASPGQMNINPYGWTKDGSERTSYPAQVRIRVQKNCQPLVENQFKPIIKGNYYTQVHFLFELDHVQVSKLMALFSSQVVAPSVSGPKIMGNRKRMNRRLPEPKNTESNAVVPSEVYAGAPHCNESNGHLNPTYPSACPEEMYQPSEEAMEKDDLKLIYDKLQKLVVDSEQSDCSAARQEHDSADSKEMQAEADDSQEREVSQDVDVEDSPLSPADYPSIISKLIMEVQELKLFKQDSIRKIGRLEQQLHKLELKSSQSLADDVMRTVPWSDTLGSCMPGTMMDPCSEQHLDTDDSIFLAGGFDGKSWLASLELYYPSKDIIKPLCPMNSIRAYTSTARLNGDLYVIGGGCGPEWYNTVERYSPSRDDCSLLACLNEKKGGLAAVTLHDKIFAFGGGNGVNCFSDVEMFDLDVGRWISARSMLHKRFALASVELNGALYATGGFDEKDYLSSTERFDPREHSWSRLQSMNSRRGCHSMVVLNEKIYAVGGFDGSKMVATVEVFDPRLSTWMEVEPMNHQRGYSTAVVLNNRIYALGGLDESQKMVEKVEWYEEGHGWQMTDLKAMGRRVFASAIAY